MPPRISRGGYVRKMGKKEKNKSEETENSELFVDDDYIAKKRAKDKSHFDYESALHNDRAAIIFFWAFVVPKKGQRIVSSKIMAYFWDFVLTRLLKN
jgi:hypothetical protein